MELDGWNPAVVRRTYYGDKKFLPGIEFCEVPARRGEALSAGLQERTPTEQYDKGAENELGRSL